MNWECENCGNTEMEALFQMSLYNGNKDDTWYCEKCNPELARSFNKEEDE